jgi:hypothetical protein
LAIAAVVYYSVTNEQINDVYLKVKQYNNGVLMSDTEFYSDTSSSSPTFNKQSTITKDGREYVIQTYDGYDVMFMGNDNGGHDFLACQKSTEQSTVTQMVDQSVSDGSLDSAANEFVDNEIVTMEDGSELRRESLLFNQGNNMVFSPAKLSGSDLALCQDPSNLDTLRRRLQPKLRNRRQLFDFTDVAGLFGWVFDNVFGFLQDVIDGGDIGTFDLPEPLPVVNRACNAATGLSGDAKMRHDLMKLAFMAYSLDADAPIVDGYTRVEGCTWENRGNLYANSKTTTGDFTDCVTIRNRNDDSSNQFMFAKHADHGDTCFIAWMGTFTAQGAVADLKCLKTKQWYGHTVGSGFADHFETVETVFKAEVEARGCTKFHITGHSLGGALSDISSLYLHKAMGVDIANIDVTTFGQPRVFAESTPFYVNHKDRYVMPETL